MFLVFINYILFKETCVVSSRFSRKKTLQRRVADDREVEKSTETGGQLQIYNEEVNGIRKL